MTRLLLDTHALIFWFGSNPRLGVAARSAIGDPDNEVHVSAASAWEIATKFRIGKLADVGDPATNVPRLLAANGFRSLDVTVDHGLIAGSLQGSHRDPFDRLIAAQGLAEDMTVVTRDRELAAFGCKTLW